MSLVTQGLWILTGLIAEKHLAIVMEILEAKAQVRLMLPQLLADERRHFILVGPLLLVKAMVNPKVIMFTSCLSRMVIRWESVDFQLGAFKFLWCIGIFGG